MFMRTDAVPCAQDSPIRGDEGSQIRIRVLLVEHDETCWSFLKTALQPFAIECVVAESLSSARQLLSSLGDDIDAVLLNLNLPDGRGEDLLPAVQARARKPGLVVFSDSPEQVPFDARAYRAVLSTKRIEPPKLAAILRSTTGGHVHPTVQRFVRRFRLTNRESEILHRLASGISPKQTALGLGCSCQAVYAHLAKIGKKTGCRGYQEVIAKLLQFSCHGLEHSVRDD